jgi:hypothetical protein
MTPGFAKPRSELPWLPYESLDRVIINAHNFNPPFSPIVNGKTPSHVWCPSRDTAGNGTTTLHDLVGSNNGTLTNMDAATDWVSDTGAGGVRALDFDGSNDYIAFSGFNVAGGPGGAVYKASVSLWFKTSSTSAQRLISSSTGNLLGLVIDSATSMSIGNAGGTSAYSVSGITDGNWHHAVCSFPANGSVKLWLDGVDKGTQSVGSTTTITILNAFGRRSAAQYFVGRMDDIRVFDPVLDSSDVAFLYSGGQGRGISA